MSRHGKSSLRSVSCGYLGEAADRLFLQRYARCVCPHVIGYSKDSKEMALIYQFSGTSSKGLAPGGEWRCFEIALVRDAQAVDGEWHTGSVQARQTCVATVVAESAS